jgi:hypothetical protein
MNRQEALRTAGAIRIALSMAILAILAASQIAGCASRTPTDTVTLFIAAVEDGEYYKARVYVTERLSEEVGPLDETLDAMIESPDPAMGLEPWQKGHLVCDMEGDTACVRNRDFESVRWVLKKEGGAWKIDCLECDMDELQDEIEGRRSDRADRRWREPAPENRDTP